MGDLPAATTHDVAPPPLGSHSQRIGCLGERRVSLCPSVLKHGIDAEDGGKVAQ